MFVYKSVLSDNDNWTDQISIFSVDHTDCSNKGRFIIYGDDRVGKSERNICFFPDTRVKIMPEF